MSRFILMISNALGIRPSRQARFERLEQVLGCEGDELLGKAANEVARRLREERKSVDKEEGGK